MDTQPEQRLTRCTLHSIEHYDSEDCPYCLIEHSAMCPVCEWDNCKVIKDEYITASLAASECHYLACLSCGAESDVFETLTGLQQGSGWV
jgi:hypothetical protein